MKHAGTQTKGTVELNDLYPTLVELSGLGSETPSILQGESLDPFLQSPSKTDATQFAYTNTAQNGASIRTHRWRYNRWGENAEGTNEELYDHDKDPREFANLVNDAEYTSALKKIRSRFEQARNIARGGKSQN